MDNLVALPLTVDGHDCRRLYRVEIRYDAKLKRTSNNHWEPKIWYSYDDLMMPSKM